MYGRDCGWRHDYDSPFIETRTPGRTTMLEITTHDGITLLQFDHGKANTLDLELCRHLVDVLKELETAGGGAIVLTAKGSIFSAGVDLKRLVDSGAPYAREFLPALVASIRALFEYPGPVVAAVNGHAVAGGCVLACAADRCIIADTNARVGVPELRVGVPFPAAAIEIMRAALSPSRFRALALGGATLDPAGALEWGLVDEVVAPESLLTTALAAARDMASIPAQVFAVTKKQMRMPALEQIDAADRRYGDEVLEQWMSPVTMAAVRAYVERTLRRPAAAS
jgi:enoyl-CoA hydratase